MGPDAAIVVEATKALISGNINQYDAEVPPIPWREEIFTSKKRLRIGYYEDTKLITPTPVVKRAMKEAVAILEVRFRNLKDIQSCYWPL